MKIICHTRDWVSDLRTNRLIVELRSWTTVWTSLPELTLYWFSEENGRLTYLVKEVPEPTKKEKSKRVTEHESDEEEKEEGGGSLYDRFGRMLKR